MVILIIGVVILFIIGILIFKKGNKSKGYSNYNDKMSLLNKIKDGCCSHRI